MKGRAKDKIGRLVGSGVLLSLLILAGCSSNIAVIHNASVGTGVDAQTVDLREGAVELKTPQAVEPATRYRVLGSNGTLIAYSLKAAATASIDVQSGFSPAMGELGQIGGINMVLGAIIDPASQDVIIVGRQDPDLPPLTLDELATILRAVFVAHKAPFISIDPPQVHPLINDGTTEVQTLGPVQRDQTIPGFQSVRTDGGVVDTQVGANMIDADFRMKLIMLGLLPSGIKSVDDAAGNLSLTSSILLQLESQDRFEFYPDANGIYVDRLFVVLAGGGLLAVRTEREKGSAELATAERVFAGELSAHTRELAIHHTTIGSIYIYSQLYALAVGLQSAQADAYVSPLLDRYQPARVPTARRIPEIAVSRSLVELSRNSQAMKFMAWLAQVPANALTVFHSGGVLLGGYSVNSTLRQGGLGIRSAILKSRPSSSAVSWTYNEDAAGVANTANISSLIGILDVSTELERLRAAAATGLVETVLELADRILAMTTQEPAVREAERTLAIASILADRERDGARLLSNRLPELPNRIETRNLIDLLGALADARERGVTEDVIFPEPDTAGHFNLIWALALSEVGQIDRACSLLPDVPELATNYLTVDLALECADKRSDVRTLARYLDQLEQHGMNFLAADYYRGEVERLSGRPDIAATWYYSFLGEIPGPTDARVVAAKAFLDRESPSYGNHPFDVPAGFGIVVLVRNGQWAGSANGRLVTSETGDRIYGRLGPGEFLIIPLHPGAKVLRLLGSLAAGIHTELYVDVKDGQIAAFDVQTLSRSVAADAGTANGALTALSCAKSVSGNSPMASGGQVIGIALGCLAVGAAEGIIDWGGQKMLERHDDFLVGAALNATPVLNDAWRQTIQSMHPVAPWGATSP